MPIAPNLPSLAPGVWLALLAEADPVAFRRVVDELADEYTEEYGLNMQGALDALQLKPLPPRERLMRYLLKPLVAWIEQQQKYPKDFREDMADFRRLRDRALRGDFDEVLA